MDQDFHFSLTCDAVFVERDPFKGISRGPTYCDQDRFTVGPGT